MDSSRVELEPGRRVGLRLLLMGAATLAVPLVAHALIGWYSRPVADDFCMAKASHDEGVFGSVWMWYRTWSGRWAHFLVFNLTEAVGRWTVRILPAVLIAGLVASTAWAIARAGRRLGYRSAGAAALLAAETFAVATFAGARAPFLSLYWRPGIVAYFVPWILLAVAAGLVARAEPDARDGSVRPRALAAGLAFVAGGFYETQTMAQIAALAVVALYGRRRFLPSASRAIWWMLAASVASLIVLVVAPGNAVRIEQQAQIAGPVDAVAGAASATWRFLGESLTLAPLGLLLALGIGLTLGWASRKAVVTVLPVVCVGTVFTLFASMLPSSYTGYDYPTPRVLVIPQAVLVGGVLLLGFFAGGLALNALSHVNRRWIASGSVAVLALGLLWTTATTTRNTLAPRDIARAYAANVDARDGVLRQMRAQGVRDVTLDLLPTPQRRWVAGIDVTWQRDSLINACIAKYYGFDSLIGRVRT